MKKLLALMVVSAIWFANVNAYATCASNDIQCNKVAGTQKFRVTTTGDTYVGRNLDVTNQVNIHGNLVVDGQTIPVGDIIAITKIRTATASPYGLVLSSGSGLIPASTPTEARILAISEANVLYLSTGTGPGAWVKIGAQ